MFFNAILTKLLLPLSFSVLFGAPGGDLEAATTSLAAARGAIEALHTAPLPRLVTPEEVTEATGGDREGEEEQQGARVCGHLSMVNIDSYFIQEDMGCAIVPLV